MLASPYKDGRREGLGLVRSMHEHEIIIIKFQLMKTNCHIYSTSTQSNFFLYSIITPKKCNDNFHFVFDRE